MVPDNDIQVLTGWKAIAGFIRRDERTAMRWASYRGLPVRRVPGGKRGPVYAIPAEISSWLERALTEPSAALPCDDVSERSPAIVFAPTGDVQEGAPPAAADRPEQGTPGSPAPAVGPVPARRGALIAAMAAAALAGAAMTAAATSTVLSGKAPVAPPCAGANPGPR